MSWYHRDRGFADCVEFRKKRGPVAMTHLDLESEGAQEPQPLLQLVRQSVDGVLRDDGLRVKHNFGRLIVYLDRGQAKAFGVGPELHHFKAGVRLVPEEDRNGPESPHATGPAHRSEHKPSTVYRGTGGGADRSHIVRE